MEAYLEDIERIRQKLAEVVQQYHGNLLHPVVLQVSQQLDNYIVHYQSRQ
jgi:hypothetical protein